MPNEFIEGDESPEGQPRRDAGPIQNMPKPSPGGGGCTRRGVYANARLAERFGRETALPDLLRR
jgi:hypothetical protein